MIDYGKSPCLTCTRVHDPEECNDKSCGRWRAWWLAKWEQIHRPTTADIGPRMAEEVKRVCAMHNMRQTDFVSSTYSIHQWKSGKLPSTYYLIKLSQLGGDAGYVLTGRRGGQP